MKLAVQLYSVRDHIKTGDDLIEILPRVKALGYDGVEFAGFFGLETGRLREALDSAGLRAVGAHMRLDCFADENLEQTLRDCLALGMPAAGVGAAAHKTLHELEQSCRVLREADAAARALGMRVYYHNHWDEFEYNEDGILPFSMLREACALEIDTYWSHHAGQDNRRLIEDNADKIVHLHVKDGVGRTPMALGEGDCDVRRVVAAAEGIGLEWLIVENDDPVPCGLDDIERSIKYLKKII